MQGIRIRFINPHTGAAKGWSEYCIMDSDNGFEACFGIITEYHLFVAAVCYLLKYTLRMMRICHGRLLFFHFNHDKVKYSVLSGKGRLNSPRAGHQKGPIESPTFGPPKPFPGILI